MAIVQEHFDLNGVDFIRTYSDNNRYVVGGEPYSAYTEACDPAEFGRTYIEGDVIPSDDTDAEELLNILLGGDSE